MWWDGYWHGHWFVGAFFMIAVLVICMGLMFVMMRGMMGGGYRRQDALDTLRERFARGEINRTQYEEQRRVLES
jgi:putative membrane protein